jgi:hypothetical protein
MTQNGTGPKCPQPKRLRDLIEVVGNSNTPEITLDEEHDIIDALEWLAVMLENRALYHKKQQIKKKIIFALASERGLIDEVNSLTDSVLHQHVSNQPPDREDAIDLGLDNITGDNE